MKQFVRFELFSTSEKTKIWNVFSTHSGDFLGDVRWSGPWRQYVFDPAADTEWSCGCLDQVAEFLREQNSQHAGELARRKGAI